MLHTQTNWSNTVRRFGTSAQHCMSSVYHLLDETIATTLSSPSTQLSSPDKHALRAFAAAPAPTCDTPHSRCVARRLTTRSPGDEQTRQTIVLGAISDPPASHSRRAVTDGTAGAYSRVKAPQPGLEPAYFLTRGLRTTVPFHLRQSSTSIAGAVKVYPHPL